MPVYRVNSQKSFAHVDMLDLVAEAKRRANQPGSVVDFTRMADLPEVGMFVHVGSDPDGISTIVLPTDTIVPFPLWALLYARAGSEAAQPLIECGLDFLASYGYTSFRALNQSGHSDEAWAKALFSNPRMGPPRRVATMMEVSINERVH